MKNVHQSDVFIDDGTRAYRFVNGYGEEIATVHFRPADAGLVSRFDHLRDELENMVEPITRTSDTAPNAEKLEAIRKSEANITRLFSDLFGSADIDRLFQHLSPLSFVNGELFCVSVANVLSGIIHDAVAEEQQNAESRRRNSRLDNQLS